MGAKGKPEVESVLVFRGMDRCDGCGAALDPKDRLAGLCESCAGLGTDGERPQGGGGRPER